MSKGMQGCGSLVPPRTMWRYVRHLVAVLVIADVLGLKEVEKGARLREPLEIGSWKVDLYSL